MTFVKVGFTANTEATASDMNQLETNIDTATSAAPYDASVGTGGTYTDIQAAITGIGGTDIKLLLLSNVTEDSDIVIPSGANLVIDLSSYTLTMGNYAFTYSAASNVYIYGNGIDSGAEIDWTHTVIGEQLFENASYPTSILTISNISLDDNSSATTTYLSSAVEIINNVKLYMPDVADAGGFVPQAEGCFYSNIHIVGGGTNTTHALRVLSNRATINGVYMTGTFSTSACMTLSGAQCSNIIFNHSTGATKVDVLDNAEITGLRNISAEILNMDASGNGVILNGIDITSGTFDMLDADNCKINALVAATLDMTSASATKNLFINCRITNAVTVNGDLHKFTNCDILGGATIVSGADDNGFCNCQFGADAGAGVLTLTVDSGSNRTRVIGCMGDALISDDGTDTAIVAWQTY